MVMCCIPQDIVQCSFPDILDTNSAVQVFCSNPFCWQSGLLHSSCFYKWEDKVVRYLVSKERYKINIDRRVMDSLLWTKQMWDLPLPAKLTACKCGEGAMKRLFEDEKHAEQEVFKLERNADSLVSGVLTEIRQGLGGGGGDGNCKGFSEKGSADHVEGSWEVVSRAKTKKKEISNVKNVEKSLKRSIKPPANKLAVPQTPAAGPDPVKAFRHGGQAEGRRDSDGLIHCCSCKTVHSSLPDFIKHCKTSQHTKEVLGDVNNNDDSSEREDEILNLRREVNHLKKGLVEVMKQGLEKDISVGMEFEQFKEKCITELNKKDAIMAILIEKFQGLEEKFLEVEEKLSSVNSLVKNNESDIDACFDHCQDLTKNLADLSQDHKSFKKINQSAQDKLDVKVKDLNVVAVSEVSSSKILVDPRKSVRSVAIGKYLVHFVSLFVVFLTVVLAITLLW